MDIFDQILENLELERDLGTRTVEIDRALLVSPPPERVMPVSPSKPAPTPVTVQEPPARVSPLAPEVSAAATSAATPPRADAAVPQCDVAFFTGRPLSPEGQVAMDKTFAAMRRLRPDITVCLTEERKAKVMVLLGSDALQKRLPTARPVRGAWVSVLGTPAIMTFSPDYIFSHFQEGSSNMNKAKLEMWNDIKLAIARL